MGYTTEDAIGLPERRLVTRVCVAEMTAEFIGSSHIDLDVDIRVCVARRPVADADLVVGVRLGCIGWDDENQHQQNDGTDAPENFQDLLLFDFVQEDHRSPAVIAHGVALPLALSICLGKVQANLLPISVLAAGTTTLGEDCRVIELQLDWREGHSNTP